MKGTGRVQWECAVKSSRKHRAEYEVVSGRRGEEREINDEKIKKEKTQPRICLALAERGLL